MVGMWSHKALKIPTLTECDVSSSCGKHDDDATEFHQCSNTFPIQFRQMRNTSSRMSFSAVHSKIAPCTEQQCVAPHRSHSLLTIQSWVGLQSPLIINLLFSMTVALMVFVRKFAKSSLLLMDLNTSRHIT
eukprot:TRINITY_DN67948_c0_g6_i3.p1 TRINITY_DN67948_c0_g6~~TRINITY_DN67948_c0_g6_i3.p1  ORF type:complete len:131 (+),score=11.43 TRINITY_DN67948_c0_g6_i3:159-551(+)